VKKKTYSVQCLWYEEWVTILPSENKSFAQGYFARIDEEDGVRSAYRLICDQDQKIIGTIEPNEKVAIGMIVGFPTPEQYEAAAKEALEKAARIREIMKRHKKD